MEMHIKKVPNTANVWLSPFSSTWFGFTRPTKTIEHVKITQRLSNISLKARNGNIFAHNNIIHGYNLHDFAVRKSNVFVPPMTHVQKHG